MIYRVFKTETDELCGTEVLPQMATAALIDRWARGVLGAAQRKGDCKGYGLQAQQYYVTESVNDRPGQEGRVAHAFEYGMYR